MAKQQSTFKQRVKNETALFLALLFLGLVVVPVAIFMVGEQFFGEYGGHGFGDFFGTLTAKIRAGDLVAWFLVLSPYLAWQTLRLTISGWRYLSSPDRVNSRAT